MWPEERVKEWILGSDWLPLKSSSDLASFVPWFWAISLLSLYSGFLGNKGLMMAPTSSGCCKFHSDHAHELVASLYWVSNMCSLNASYHYLYILLINDSCCFFSFFISIQEISICFSAPTNQDAHLNFSPFKIPGRAKLFELYYLQRKTAFFLLKYVCPLAFKWPWSWWPGLFWTIRWQTLVYWRINLLRSLVPRIQRSN